MSGSPMLAAITLTSRGDGVAVVARLLHEALRRRTGGCSVVTMFDGPARRPSLQDKATFATRIDGQMIVDQPRWVFFSHMNLTRVMRFVPSRLRRPYAVFLHGVESWQPLRAADRALLAGATLRLANSHYTANRAMQANPDIGPVLACPLALPQTAAPIEPNVGRTAPLANPDAPVVLIVGALRSEERYKGHDQLIDSWQTVVASVPDAQLLIVGDGDDRPRIQALVEQRRLGGSVSLPGYLSNEALAACYARAAVFAMPSRGEGFGLVYLEAMTHGLPCVGSRQDAASEVIQDGVTGVLVDQHDIAGLAAALVALLSDAPRRRAMGLAGRARVQKEFAVSTFQSRLDAALDQAFPVTA